MSLRVRQEKPKKHMTGRRSVMKKNTTKMLMSFLLTAAVLTGCSARSQSTSPVVMEKPSETAGRYIETEACYDTATEEGCFFYEPVWMPDTESYEKGPENGFFITKSAPLSTFSASVDTASYANVRRMIEQGYTLDEIDPDAVRAEEFINYFRYDLNKPKTGEVFGITTEMADCPWNDRHKLLMVGMRTDDIDLSERPASNLVFLIDVSGSMDENNKLPLLVKSFKQLSENLTGDDRVSIVTYANGVDTVLTAEKGSNREAIFAALDSLTASGATNGEGGIQRAYECAENGFISDGINRVIIATDGDLNVGVSDPDGLQRLIEEKRASGIYLSVLGFGMGNYKDDNLERLANYGNGNYAYIDSLLEAKKVLVEEMGATLMTVANDVKLQVEFNPARVNAYRLIGYENRMLEATDFNDDTKDAAEIGAGHSVIALYEIIETGSSDEIALKYGDVQDGTQTETAFRDEFATVNIRYKKGVGESSGLVSVPVTEEVLTDEPSDDFLFATCAAEFAMVLSNSSNRGSATLETIMETCRALDLQDEYRNEFYYLVRKLSARA